MLSTGIGLLGLSKSGEFALEMARHSPAVCRQRTLHVCKHCMTYTRTSFHKTRRKKVGFIWNQDVLYNNRCDIIIIIRIWIYMNENVYVCLLSIIQPIPSCLCVYTIILLPLPCRFIGQLIQKLNWIEYLYCSLFYLG